jgi:hypothetical protein
MSDNESLTKQRDQWMRNYYRISHEYDRLQRIAGMYFIATFILSAVVGSLAVVLGSR